MTTNDTPVPDPGAPDAAAPNPVAPDPVALLALATDLARQAGALALAMHAGLGSQHAGLGAHDTKSTPTDVVTAADRASEQLLADGIRAARPGDGILGEEGACDAGTTGVRWVVDPIDGTVNYLYGLPHWAVSIGVEVDGTTVAGVVLNPAAGELFSAVRGGGATLNGAPLRCSAANELAQTLVATGFGYDARRRTAQAAVVQSVLPAVRDLRRQGAGALDLCAVAAGRVDAYYEQGLSPWDMSAGLLIATEAGARTGGLRGREPSYDLVLATAPDVFDALHDLLVAADADADPLAQCRTDR